MREVEGTSGMARRNKFQPGLGLVLSSASELHAFGGVSPITGEFGALGKKNRNINIAHTAQICILQSIWCPNSRCISISICN